MNISAKFQLYHHYSFSGVDFINIFRKFNISVFMTTKETEGFGQNCRFVGGPLSKRF